MHLLFLHSHHNEMTYLHKIICSLVLPILEHCFLNCSCKAGQSLVIGCRDSYHTLASPTNVKQNLPTFKSSSILLIFIQSLVQRRWASAFSSGLPANSGLNVTNSRVAVVDVLSGELWVVGVVPEGLPVVVVVVQEHPLLQISPTWFIA